jgi:hypothetical protein
MLYTKMLPRSAESEVKRLVVAEVQASPRDGSTGMTEGRRPSLLVAEQAVVLEAAPGRAP